MRTPEEELLDMAAMAVVFHDVQDAPECINIPTVLRMFLAERMAVAMVDDDAERGNTRYERMVRDARTGWPTLKAVVILWNIILEENGVPPHDKRYMEEPDTIRVRSTNQPMEERIKTLEYTARRTAKHLTALDEKVAQLHDATNRANDAMAETCTEVRKMTSALEAFIAEQRAVNTDTATA